MTIRPITMRQRQISIVFTMYLEGEYDLKQVNTRMNQISNRQESIPGMRTFHTMYRATGASLFLDALVFRGNGPEIVHINVTNEYRLS